MSIPRTLSESVTRLEPQYVRGARPLEYWAHFPSGAVVKAERSRDRRYPSLEGPAPPTLALYRQCIDRSVGSGVVVDVGCGSGAGTRILNGAFSRVVGLDRDRLALAFARQYCPGAEYLHADACGNASLHEVQAAVVIDVLGQVASPYDALTALRERLLPGAWLYVAEPLAHPAQELVVPVRRAFSLQGLTSILTRAGFCVNACQTTNGFCALLAHPSPTDDWRRLREIGELTQEFDPESAHRLLRGLPVASSSAVELEVMLMEASALMVLGELTAAERLLEQLARIHPNDARSSVALARIALSLNQRERALTAVNEAISADPGEPSAARAFALVTSALQPDKAVEAWQRYGNLSPDSEEATHRLAEELLQLGDELGRGRVLARLARYNGLPH